MYRSSQHNNNITRYIIERENDGSDGDDSDILMVMAVMKLIEVDVHALHLNIKHETYISCYKIPAM